MRMITGAILFAGLLVAAGARQMQGPRVVDLKAADGAALKASYVAASKPASAMEDQDHA